MKEFPSESKNKWTRIFRKKWFFPALYIVLAAFLLSAVVWYQNVQSKMFDGLDGVGDHENEDDDFQSDRFDEEAESVVKQEEIIKMPVEEEAQTEIVTTFFDYSAEEEEQEKGLTFYNNRYYQSTGVDIAMDDGEAFEVMASLSGDVDEIKEDPLHGNVVVLNHGDDITTYYASLEEVAIKEGDKLEQGDVIGTSGKNLFSEESGNHVHFELRKEDTELDPEDFFNQTLQAVQEIDMEDASMTDSERAAEEAEEENEDQADIDAEEDEEMDEPADEPEDIEEDDPAEENSENDEDAENNEEAATTKDLSLSFPV